MSANIIDKKMMAKVFKFLFIVSMFGCSIAQAQGLCDKAQKGIVLIKKGQITDFSATLWLSSMGSIDCTELDQNDGLRFNCGGNIVFGDLITTKSGHRLRTGTLNFQSWNECIEAEHNQMILREWMSWEGQIPQTGDAMRFKRYIDRKIQVIEPTF